MKTLRRLARVASLRLRGVTVTALVGKSGTGKSFRARLLAEKHGIELIVDDGLLVHRGAMVAGHWAKKEDTLLAATRRALFEDPGQAEEARGALRTISLRSALIVGTSQRMAERIADALDLPRPSNVISVDEIARAEEIRAAGQERRRAGTHALPAPVVGIRRTGLRGLAARAGVLLSALRRGAVRGRGRPAAVASEKPVRGSVSISEDALRQMVCHCVAEHDPRMAVERVRAREQAGMHEVEIGLRIPFGHGTAGDLHRLRDYVLHSLERHGGIVVKEVHLVVETVGDPLGTSRGTP